MLLATKRQNFFFLEEPMNVHADSNTHYNCFTVKENVSKKWYDYLHI